jgi:hypothetical protein
VRLSLGLPGSAADVVKAVRAAGLEGVIAKRRDSVYQPGERSADSACAGLPSLTWSLQPCTDPDPGECTHS